MAENLKVALRLLVRHCVGMPADDLFKPAEHHSVGQLLDDRAPFVVDPYQRDYAWNFVARPSSEFDDGEVADFIYDLGRLLDEVRRDPAAQKYFFGLMVAAVQDNSGWLPSELHEIVDGQQRLTTFVLLGSAMIQTAKAIQKAAQREEDHQAEEQCRNFIDFMTERCIERDLRSTTGAAPRTFDVLSLTEGDNEFFQRLIRGEEANPGTRDSCRLLADAKAALDVAVREWIPQGTAAEQAVELTKIRNVLFDHTQLVLIIGKSKVDAYRLFSVANNRGRRLEQADLLRAYLLRLADSSKSPQVKIRIAALWNELDSRPPEKVNAALRGYYASLLGVRAPKIDVYDSYVHDVFRHAEHATLTQKQGSDLTNQVAEICQGVSLYNDVFLEGKWPFPRRSGGPSKWERNLIELVVVRLKSTRAVPLLMAAATVWKKSERDFVRLVLFLEKAELRLLVSRSHPSTVADRYFEAAEMVRLGKSVDEVITFLEAWVAFLADDERFHSALLSLNYTQGKARIRHLLAMLDDHRALYLAKKEGRPLPVLAPNKLREWDLGTADLDHIYPRSGGDSPDADLEPVKNRMGNLALLLDKENQQQARTLSPTSKKKLDIYRASNVRLTEAVGKEIAGARKWTRAMVEHRQTELAEMAMVIYAISSKAKKAAERLDPSLVARVSARGALKVP